MHRNLENFAEGLWYDRRLLDYCQRDTWNNLPLASVDKTCEQMHSKHWNLTDTFGDKIYNKSTKYTAFYLCDISRLL